MKFQAIRIIVHVSRQFDMSDHLYLVAYDISEPGRWRKIFKMLHGFGESLQFSIFQCQLSRSRRVELELRLREIIKAGDDHLLIIDIGPANKANLRITSIGKTFNSIERKPVVI